MKKAVIIALSFVGLSFASENITITKEMADALGKNEITKLFLETGNSLVGATVSTTGRGYSICDAKNKNDCISCVTQGVEAEHYKSEKCDTFANDVKVSSKEFNIDYIRKFYVDIIKIHRKVK